MTLVLAQALGFPHMALRPFSRLPIRCIAFSGYLPLPAKLPSLNLPHTVRANHELCARAAAGAGGRMSLGFFKTPGNNSARCGVKKLLATSTACAETEAAPLRELPKKKLPPNPRKRSPKLKSGVPALDAQQSSALQKVRFFTLFFQFQFYIWFFSH